MRWRSSKSGRPVSNPRSDEYGHGRIRCRLVSVVRTLFGVDFSLTAHALQIRRTSQTMSNTTSTVPRMPPIYMGDSLVLCDQRSVFTPSVRGRRLATAQSLGCVACPQFGEFENKGIVGEADQLVRELMLKRGYPVGDFEARAAYISVDHPGIVETCRTAQAIAVRDTRGEAETEELRKAVVHYRTSFEELLEVRAPDRTYCRRDLLPCMRRILRECEAATRSTA